MRRGERRARVHRLAAGHPPRGRFRLERPRPRAGPSPRGEQGVVLAGVSAGAMCWFKAGLTNSLGSSLGPVAGLGLLDGGFCPDAGSNPARLVALRDLIDRGLMPSTLAVDDAAAVHAPGRPATATVGPPPGRALG